MDMLAWMEWRGGTQDHVVGIYSLALAPSRPAAVGSLCLAENVTLCECIYLRIYIFFLLIMVYTRCASSEVVGCYSTSFAQFVRTCLAILGYGIQYEQGLRALGRLGFCSSFLRWKAAPSFSGRKNQRDITKGKGKTNNKP